MSFSLVNRTRQNPPTLPYEKIARDIVGGSYVISLVFVGDRKSRQLNYAYRGKSYVPNVLSFPLTATHGEIFINPTQARREAKKFGMSGSGFIGYLFIHGLLHLKGYEHSDTMDRVEARYTKRYQLA